MTTQFFGLTDTGKTRENNEDSFLAEEIGDNALVLAAVIDGVGGYHGGEIAAAILKEELSKRLSVQSSAIIPDMSTAFRKANQTILDRKISEPEYAEMACVATSLVADTTNNKFYYAHVGDTRLYLYRDGSLVKISKDQSFVGFLEDSGRLNEGAAMAHPKRNEINKAVGFSNQIDTDEGYIEIGESPFLPGDLLLLCSDGLTDMVNRDGILSMLSQGDSLETKASNLVNLANENGGKDNITVVLVQNLKTPQKTIPAKHESMVNKPSLKEKPLEPITENKSSAVPNKKGFGFVALVILCIILLGSTIFLYLQGQQKQVGKVEEVIVKHQKNSQEQLLQDAFDHATGDTLVLSDSIFKSPIIISDTLRIKRDSLFIMARGMVLQAATNYVGTALFIGAENRVTGIDSLTFKGFKNAITLSNSKLLLNNTSFVNCLLPVQNNYRFPSKTAVSAEIKFSSFGNKSNLVKPQQ